MKLNFRFKFERANQPGFEPGSPIPKEAALTIELHSIDPIKNLKLEFRSFLGEFLNDVTRQRGRELTLLWQYVWRPRLNRHYYVTEGEGQAVRKSSNLRDVIYSKGCVIFVNLIDVSKCIKTTNLNASKTCRTLTWKAIVHFYSLHNCNFEIKCLLQHFLMYAPNLFSFIKIYSTLNSF